MNQIVVDFVSILLQSINRHFFLLRKSRCLAYAGKKVSRYEKPVFQDEKVISNEDGVVILAI